MKRTLALVAAVVASACGGSGKDGGNATPGEPNDTIAQATPMTLGTPMVGSISTQADVDVHKLTIPPGGATVRIQTFDQGGVDCDSTNEAVDTKIVVYDATGATVAESDDSGLVWCEDFNVPLAAGTSYVAVSGWPPVPFGYTLKVAVP
ncbi:MAG TPA: hypothetical protein VFR85_15685 [Anaeromyxobacteraceae bacterium]|nr:hypothetical protein [Anaeromyxobacteraceae bacterium]